jgi:hypothetical protein
LVSQIYRPPNRRRRLICYGTTSRE